MSEDNKNVLGNEIDNLRDVLDNLQTPFYRMMTAPAMPLHTLLKFHPSYNLCS